MSQIHATEHSSGDELISAAVRGLIAHRRANTGEVALAAGVSRAALYRKLATTSPWQATEVDRLARFFQVSRDSLFEGRAEPAGTVTDAFGARSSTDRASDYGSLIGARPAPARRHGRRSTDAPHTRHLRIVASGDGEPMTA